MGLILRALSLASQEARLQVYLAWLWARGVLDLYHDHEAKRRRRCPGIHRFDFGTGPVHQICLLSIGHDGPHNNGLPGKMRRTWKDGGREAVDGTIASDLAELDADN